ncbi:MAG: heat-inducible transcription repressor HrcA [Candidatus Omnitrophica bacterium]|nr:heat-inducible transcription repressor HrcA [Candidatus Omnitrophota bacterium]
MVVTDLESRRNRILDLIITSYINTGTPVGSFYISKRFKSLLSSATIRNVMAQLEEEGYLTHIHTSSGRIPTDKGFRFYVDSLKKLDRLSQIEMERIDREFEEKKQVLEEIIKKASLILSSITKQAGVVLFPRLKRSIFRRVELVFIEPRKILAVLVTSSGLLRDVIVELDTDIRKEELEKISVFLNSKLEGMPIYEVKRHLLAKLEAQKDSLFSLFKVAFEIIRLSLLFNEAEELYINGLTNILEQPEFRNIEKARNIIRKLEERLGLFEILNKGLAEEGPRVYIGNEYKNPFIESLSLITSSYKIGGEVAGVVGVVGPTRMDYGRIIPIVNYIAKILSERLQ